MNSILNQHKANKKKHDFEEHSWININFVKFSYSHKQILI